MQKQSIRWIGIVLALTLVSSILAYSIGQSSAQVSSSTVATLNQWSQVNDCTYQVFTDGTTIYAKSCTTGAIDFSGTDAATVINDVFSEIDSLGGGSVYVKGDDDPYLIKTALVIPDSGHLTFYGDGSEYTVLQVPSGFDNNLFEFTGVKTANAFFNTFRDFQAIGNKGTGGANNKGFFLNSTDFGITDSLWFNLFLRDFATDAIFVSSTSKWNNQLDHVTIEHSGRAGLYDDGGTAQDFKVTNSKFLYNDQYGIFLEGDLGTYIGNWFYQNDQTAFWLEDTARSNVIIGNRFAYSSFGTNNAYDDLHLFQADSNVIVGNVFDGSTGAANKVRYGVYIDSFSSTNVVHSNVFSTSASFGTGQLFFSTTSNTSTVRDNANFVTENKGTGTIDNGATTEWVDHNLSYTPSAAECSVMFTENPTNTPGALFTTGFNSTHFLVNVENDPGASNLDFSWACRRI